MKAKNVEKNMKFLMQELQKEWEKPKQVHKTLLLEKKRFSKMNALIEEVVAFNHKQMDDEDTSFKDVIKINKECYVFLRLATKLANEYNKHIGEDYVALALDKEEYALFKEYLESVDN